MVLGTITALAGQSPAGACAAFVAGQGAGVVVASRPASPHVVSPLRPLRCVWRFVPSGCPLSSPAGTIFHVDCLFRELHMVPLLVCAACFFCYGALAPRQFLHSLLLPFCVHTLQGPLAGRW